MRSRRGRATAVAALGLALGACSSVLPEAPVERALVNDLRTIVRSQARDEWTVDRIALQAVAPAVAWSACQVAPDGRARALAWLDGAIAAESERLGGRDLPPAELWRKAGKDTGALDDLLELQRMRLALGELDLRAAADCPFWLEADPRFVGTQGDADRFVLVLESRGGAALHIRGSSLGFGGGGGGRVLIGGGLSQRMSLVAGVELGGTGRFDEHGKVTGVLGAALPVVLRLVDAGSVIDLELAATTFLQGARGWPPGVRAAIAFGVVTPRVGGAFSPSAVFYIGYELHPARGPDAPFHIIGIGTRIGVDVDP
ncbi:MAG: hypothetical protein U1F43_02030 [Myxococcota bacterium]